jgi:hypothetical protein
MARLIFVTGTEKSLPTKGQPTRRTFFHEQTL